MRTFHISLFSLLFAVGSVSGGWIDIQGEDDSLLNDTLLTGSYFGANPSAGTLQFWDEPVFRSGSEFVANDRVHEDGIERESLDWTNSLLGGSTLQSKHEPPLNRGLIVTEESYAGNTDSILETGTLSLETNSPHEEAYSPRRLHMPEPVSLAVWAILGAAWAGLAWHRRPSHRPSRWQGIDVEEGTRWNNEDRNAILQVIKKNRG